MGNTLGKSNTEENVMVAGKSNITAEKVWNTGDKANVRVVVVGDPGTGKSSLIATAAADAFQKNVPPVLPPTCLPADFYPERVPVTIIDTSSYMEHGTKLVQELKLADAVVLTYACDTPATLDRLSTFWLPEFRRLEVKLPVIVVGCKLDAMEDPYVSLEQRTSLIMQQFREIDTCMECSARSLIQVSEVFYYAQKAVLYPTTPLFDQETKTLKPQCVRALERIFSQCDEDGDGALSDKEMNDFQVKCFNKPLEPSEIVGVKRVVHEKRSEGVIDRGVTLSGFLFLHELFIEKGRTETTWTILRKFGYDNELKLRKYDARNHSLDFPYVAVDLLESVFDLVKLCFGLLFNGAHIVKLKNYIKKNRFGTETERSILNCLSNKNNSHIGLNRCLKPVKPKHVKEVSVTIVSPEHAPKRLTKKSRTLFDSWAIDFITHTFQIPFLVNQNTSTAPAFLDLASLRYFPILLM
ncbi:hypothetical protein MKW94_003079 [Papaver nudicaule]|uniref:Mitochondrial Rho GTPase n=1 Tax=Papaver nudicaule TaxID=74823 RepID=A0AA41S6C7_PAPNU|nr:hypothetical protein [Papaver nudicaule]